MSNEKIKKLENKIKKQNLVIEQFKKEMKFSMDMLKSQIEKTDDGMAMYESWLKNQRERIDALELIIKSL